VSLADIKLTDHTFQYRLGVTTSGLRRSLETDGQEEPIDLLRGSGKPYKILDGFRRCAAALELGWSAIKAFIHDFDEDKAIRFAFIKNVVRKSMTPMERAHALWVAQKRGFSSDELPELFGLSPKQVGRYLNLLKFPEAIQKCLDGKVMTMAHAKILADFEIENPADWKDRIAKEELDAKALKKAIKAEKRRAPGRKKEFIKRTKDGLRGYRFSVTKGTSREDRNALAASLVAALKFLERGLD
jgi:ParB/RepB/Spo0J family partition protein